MVRLNHDGDKIFERYIENSLQFDPNSLPFYSGVYFEVLFIFLQFPSISENLFVELKHFMILSGDQMWILNEFLFKMFVHLHLISPLSQLLYVWLDLLKQLIRCINVMFIIGINTFVWKFNDILQYIFWISICYLCIHWRKDITYLFILFVFHIRFIWLKSSLYFYFILLMSSFVFKNHFLLILTEVASHLFYF